MNDIPTTMRGVVLTGHGGPECLEVRHDLPVPRPGPRDVLIRVSAAGVNNTDVNTRLAWYSKQGNAAEDASWAGAPLRFPRIQGADICGRIVAVGAAVPTGRLGERVIVEPCLREADGRPLTRPWYIGSECDGGFADYAVVAARHAWSVAGPWNDVELASFPCSYSTAENLLTRAEVGPEDRVLVTGASGGVGSAVVQLAKVRGAQVVAVTGEAKSAALRALGADTTLGRHDDPVQELGQDSVDVVVDLVGGPHWSRLLEVLRPSGRYAVAGAVAGASVSLDLRTLYLKDLSFFGCTVLDSGVFAALVAYIAQERIKPLVAATYPLERIAEAQAAFLEKRHIGKIVLTLDR